MLRGDGEGRGILAEGREGSFSLNEHSRIFALTEPGRPKTRPKDEAWPK